jgi:hypothetical protein
MTGQVKEEILSRFGELGLRVAGGQVNFEPALLRTCEFTSGARRFRFLDVDGQWQTIEVPVSGLAFTWCQVPIVYRLRDGLPALTITWKDGSTQVLPVLSLPSETSSELFRRSGEVRQILVEFPAQALLGS